MTAKIYRGLISLLLLFTIGKVASIIEPDETVLAATKEDFISENQEKVVQVDGPDWGEQIVSEETFGKDFSDNDTNETIAEIVDKNSSVEDKEEITLTTQDDKEEIIIDEEIVKEKEIAEETIEVFQKLETQQVENKIQPMAMYINKQIIFYENGGEVYGQSIIDNDYNIVSTWGGASVQSGNDGLTTHFIGHNPGIFSVLFGLSIGSEVGVTDGNARLTTYQVIDIWVVDNSGYDVQTVEDTWDRITSPYQGEAIVLQTCIDDYTNLILFAIN